MIVPFGSLMSDNFREVPNGRGGGNGTDALPSIVTTDQIDFSSQPLGAAKKSLGTFFLIRAVLPVLEDEYTAILDWVIKQGSGLG